MMARTSRKKINRQEKIKADNTLYVTAIYIRKSVLDTDEAIENQILFLRQYITEHDDLKEYNVYVDNGESGTTFNRQGFKNMACDIEKGIVNCVLVKDLSRFGRNYTEVGNYIENYFPKHNVRFIAVNDSLDTLSDFSMQAYVPQNIINNYYPIDTSIKLTSVMRAKQKRGEYIGSKAPYGYKKSGDDKHKLIIDDEAAKVVKDIFTMKAEGMGNGAIAKKLNEMQIPSPNRYRYQKGLLKADRFKECLWHGIIVGDICKSRVYLGHTEQHKTHSLIMPGFPQERLPKSEWIIVEGTHTPIIEQNLFDTVQSILKKRTDDYKKYNEKPKKSFDSINFFRGKIICGECGKHFIRKKYVNSQNKVYYYFLCPTTSQNGSAFCSEKSLRETDLLEIIEREMKIQLSLLVSTVNLQSSFNNSPFIKKIIDLEKQKNNLNEKIAGLHLRLGNLYEDYADGIISLDDYKNIRDKFKLNTEQMATELTVIQKQLCMVTKQKTDQEKIVSDIKKIASKKSLISNDIIQYLIDKIIVHSSSKIEIVWDFKDEYFNNVDKEVYING